jgi:large subunit ribosomal protein L19
MAKTNSQAIVKLVEQKQIKINIPEFGPGDLVSVHLKIVENNKTRVQKFEGIVLARKSSGLSETFIVRKETDGVGVEKIFSLHSPSITKIEVIKRGRVRRAKIFYMRERTGKSARIKAAK